MKRLTVEEALQQPYLEEYYDPADEPVAGKPFEYEFEIDDLPTNTLKELVFLEVVKFKKLWKKINVNFQIIKCECS